MTPSEAAQQILQHANAAGLSPKDWADKFNKFNPNLHTQRGPMTFDPDAIEPPKELLYEVCGDVNLTCRDIAISFSQWGATQAVEALRHQWPAPIVDRPPTEEDADDLGHVLFPGTHNWTSCSWAAVADRQHIWLHTPRWRPKPEPTPKQQALALLKIAASDDFVAGGFTPDGIELLIKVVQSAPDTTT